MSKRPRGRRRLSNWIAMHINSNRWRAEAEAAKPRGFFPGMSPGASIFPTAGEK